MRLICKLTILFFFLSLPAIQGNAQKKEPLFQLVESVPVETNLGLKETERTLPVWLDMISHARKSIDIECFYFSSKKNEPLERVISSLKEASHRGVEIRILADARMRSTYPQSLEDLNRQENITVRLTDFFNSSGGVLHAKVMNVDRRDVFIGSQNFDWRALKHIHEFGLRIQNPRFGKTIALIFDLDWAIGNARSMRPISSFQRPVDFPLVNKNNPLHVVTKGGQTVQLYPSFSPAGLIYREMNRDEDEILGLIGKAQKEICIQLLSYTPRKGRDYYPTIDDALRAASVRGVRVKLIVADWSSTKDKLPYLKSLAALPGIEVKFSSLPQWSGGFIPYARVEHCKYMVIDGKVCWVGTANWAKDYFYCSRNLGVVVQGEEVAGILRKMFLKSWNSKYCKDLKWNKEYRAPRISDENQRSAHLHETFLDISYEFSYY